MYTVEFEPDSIQVISLDETAKYYDLRVSIEDDNVVRLMQESDLDVSGNVEIQISYQQLLDLMAALKSPEGAFYARMLHEDVYKGDS